MVQLCFKFINASVHYRYDAWNASFNDRLQMLKPEKKLLANNKLYVVVVKKSIEVQT